ncbi:hypothetical protein V8J82_23010 [Gymnodinialimonas sp. 2305UL16-5]
MRQSLGGQIANGIRRATRELHRVDKKIEIMVDGNMREDSIAEFHRRAD